MNIAKVSLKSPLKVPLKVLIVFGSRSDEKIFNSIFNRLSEISNVDVDLHICSAHRTPEMLLELLKNDYDVIVAGAGLGAHLPGGCASKTIAPVIGVPVNNNFLGLDSLLAIIQMPPGIPVLSVGVDNSQAVTDAINVLSKKYDAVQLLNCDDALYKKAFPLIEKFGIKEVKTRLMSKSKEDQEDHSEAPSEVLKIIFVGISEKLIDDEDSIIFCPISDDVNISPEPLLNLTKKGLWVGLNRADNAVIAAAEIIAINDKDIRDKLIMYREEMALKVIKDDEDVKNAKIN